MRWEGSEGRSVAECAKMDVLWFCDVREQESAHERDGVWEGGMCAENEQAVRSEGGSQLAVWNHRLLTEEEASAHQP